MEIDKKEALRYLGYGSHEPDESVNTLLDDCIRELDANMDCRVIAREFPLNVSEDGVIDAGCFKAQSFNLAKNLKGCKSVIVFAATIGPGIDRLLTKYGKLNVTRSVVLQAVGAAAIEVYCNEICSEWKRDYSGRGLYLRPRFSPGYGDFPLECQPDIIRGLEAEKRIGIILTEGLLMMPSKSVTAVIGVSGSDDKCIIEGCESCEKADCPYRRGESYRKE